MCTNTCCISALQKQIDILNEEKNCLTREVKYYEDAYERWRKVANDAQAEVYETKKLLAQTNKAMKLLIQSIKE